MLGHVVETGFYKYPRNSDSKADFEDEWGHSYWKDYFEETTLIIIGYQEINGSENGYRILNDVQKITFNDDDLESFKKNISD